MCYVGIVCGLRRRVHDSRVAPYIKVSIYYSIKTVNWNEIFKVQILFTRQISANQKSLDRICHQQFYPGNKTYGFANLRVRAEQNVKPHLTGISREAQSHKGTGLIFTTCDTIMCLATVSLNQSLLGSLTTYPVRHWDNYPIQYRDYYPLYYSFMTLSNPVEWGNR